MKMLRDRGEDVFEYQVENSAITRPEIITIGLGAVWNRGQYRLVREVIRQTRPDVMKVDNFFPILSPSIFEAAKSMGVSTALSVRNYRLICPSANLFREGKRCTACVGQKMAFPAIVHRCYRASYLQSATSAASNAYAHMHGVWKDLIDGYIAVSGFVKRQLVDGGFPSSKIFVKPNFVYDTQIGQGAGGYALYIGRLSEEKGIRTLMAAWSRIGKALPLKVIGEGPLQALVESSSANNESIDYLGRRRLDEVLDCLGGAQVLMFPAEWPEPFGRAIIEAYSKGTPVIAAETEPIHDMIDDGRTGLLFRAGDPDDCAEKVLSLSADPEALSQMRINARQRYLRDYTEDRNYKLMTEILGEVCHQGAPSGLLVPVFEDGRD
jgi:glycosyltransferase involved in cell wall biosynthesis